jgi:hypothetical protein
LAIFFHALSNAWRRMAHLNVLAAGHVDVEARRQKTWSWSVRYSARSSIAFSDTLLIVLLYDRADPRVRRPQNVRPAADKATASIPKITSSLDASTAQKLLETIVRPQ